MKKLFFRSILTSFLLGTSCYASYEFLDQEFTESQGLGGITYKDLHGHPQYSGRSKMDENLCPRLPVFRPGAPSPVSTPFSMIVDQNAFSRKIKEDIKRSYPDTSSITFGFVVQGLAKEQKLTEAQRQAIKADKEGKVLSNQENEILRELNSLTLVELARDGHNVYPLNNARECKIVDNIRSLDGYGGYEFNPLYWLNSQSPTFPDKESSYNLTWRAPLGEDGYNYKSVKATLPSAQAQKENSQERILLPDSTRVRGITPFHSIAVNSELWDETNLEEGRIAFTTHWLLTDKSLEDFNEVLQGAKTLRELLQNLIKKDKDAFEPLINYLKHGLHFSDVPTYKTAIPTPLRKDIINTTLMLREKHNNNTPDKELVTYLFGQKKYKGKKYDIEWNALDENEQYDFLDLLPAKLARLKFKRTVPQEALASIPTEINKKRKEANQEYFENLVDNIFKEKGYGNQWEALHWSNKRKICMSIVEQLEKMERDARSNFDKNVPETDLSEVVPLVVIGIVESKNQNSLGTIIKYALGQRYKDLWHNLGARDQFHIVEEIKDRVEDASYIARLKFNRDVPIEVLESELPAIIIMLREQKQNASSLEELVEFLLGKKGYGKQWEALGVNNQREIIKYVQKYVDEMYDKAFLDFVTVMTHKFYYGLFIEVKRHVQEGPNGTTIEDIVSTLFNQSKYKQLWQNIGAEGRFKVVNTTHIFLNNPTKFEIYKFYSAVPRKFLESLTLTIKRLKEGGNQSSVKRFVDYLFTNNEEYNQLWKSLREDTQSEITRDIETNLNDPQQLAFLEFKRDISKDFWKGLPETVRKLKAGKNKAPHKEIIGFLINEKYSEKWAKLNEGAKNKVIEKIERKINKLNVWSVNK